MFGKTTWRAIVAVGVAIGGAEAMAQPVDTALIDSGSPNDWLTYHGSYKSYHYSALDQINTGNVHDLEVAWTHVPGRSTRGLQSMPLALDGVLYYTGSYSRTFALDGATGKVIWSYFPELDEELSLGRPTRLTTAAWRSATARCLSAPSMGGLSHST